MAQARGTFEVKMAPLEAPGPQLGRMSIDKTFSGELEAASKGEMLAARGEVQGSAGYVALERVTGTLHGKRGSFTLQHSGTMKRGAPSMLVTVVPDSGVEELKGLAGTLQIEIVDQKHVYTFDYTIQAE